MRYVHADINIPSTTNTCLTYLQFIHYTLSHTTLQFITHEWVPGQPCDRVPIHHRYIATRVLATLHLPIYVYISVIPIVFVRKRLTHACITIYTMNTLPNWQKLHIHMYADSVNAGYTKKRCAYFVEIYTHVYMGSGISYTHAGGLFHVNRPTISLYAHVCLTRQIKTFQELHHSNQSFKKRVRGRPLPLHISAHLLSTTHTPA